METADKVRENRLRRWAKRLGLDLRKSRARRVHVNNRGGYQIRHADGHTIAAGERWELDMDGVEAHLRLVESDIRKGDR